MRKVEKKLASDSFINFVHQRNPEDVAKWLKWIEDHPEHEELVERTRLVIKSFDYDHGVQDRALVTSQWLELEARIRRERREFVATPRRSATPMRWVGWGAAALLTLVLSFTVWMYVTHNPMVSFETGIAQHATLSLPDGSEVTLNRNSTIRYRKNWETDAVRQVWLDGEAYFKVTNTKTPDGNSRRFEVLTNDVTIRVVGTEFSVNTIGESRVILESGRVDIQKKGDPSVLTLTPGQSVKVSEEGELILSEIKTKPHISWVDGKILLNDNSLREIIYFLESSYGLKVHCDDAALLDRKLSGSVRLDNIDDLLHVLEKVLGLVIVHHGETIKIFEIKKHKIHV